MQSNTLLDSALEYVRAGLVLVPLPLNQKRPTMAGWNQPDNLVRTEQQARHAFARPCNIGAHLASSHMCSLDLDDVERARRALSAVVIDADEVMREGWLISSGKPNSQRAEFAHLDGITTGLRSLRLLKPREEWRLSKAGKPRPTFWHVFELRGDRSNLQDVLPPSIHPDRHTPYVGAFPGRLPRAPGALLELWRDWDKLAPAMLRALGMTESIELCVMNHGASGGALRYASQERMEYNRTHSVETLLAEHGYETHGGRWRHPDATGSASVRPVPGRDGLWHSDNYTDPLCGSFDAWTAYVILDHLGALGSAEAAVAQERSKIHSAKVFQLPQKPGAAGDMPPGPPPEDGLWHASKSAQRVLISEHTPTRWYVQDALSPGAHALVGSPKVGKGYLILDLLRALDTGGALAGLPAQRADFVYVASEDNEARLHNRLKRTGGLTNGEIIDREYLGALAKHYAQNTSHVDFARMLIERYLKPGGVLILDSAESYRAIWYGEKLEGEGKARITSRDYQASRVFDTLGLETGVCIVLVNHTAKTKTHGGADFHERTNMTNAYFAGLTGSLVLALTPDDNPSNPSPERVLALRHRDHEGGDKLILLRFTPNSNFEWVGPYYQTKQTQLTQSICEEIVREVRDNGETRVSASFLAGTLGVAASTITTTLGRMFKAERQVTRVDNEYWMIHSVKGSKGGYGAVRCAPGVAK